MNREQLRRELEEFYRGTISATIQAEIHKLLEDKPYSETQFIRGKVAGLKLFMERARQWAAKERAEIAAEVERVEEQKEEERQDPLALPWFAAANRRPR